jgi:hypothetical protein
MNEKGGQWEVSDISSTRLLPLTPYHWPPTRGLMRDQPEQTRLPAA